MYIVIYSICTCICLCGIYLEFRPAQSLRVSKLRLLKRPRWPSRRLWKKICEPKGMALHPQELRWCRSSDLPFFKHGRESSSSPPVKESWCFFPQDSWAHMFAPQIYLLNLYTLCRLFGEKVAKHQIWAKQKRRHSEHVWQHGISSSAYNPWYYSLHEVRFSCTDACLHTQMENIILYLAGFNTFAK